MPAFREFDFDPHNLPDEYLKAIGLLVACSAQTEAVIDQGIAGCADVDTEKGAAITAHMSMPIRLGVLRSLAEIRISDSDKLAELDLLIDKAEAAYALRAPIVHHSWCKDPKTGEVFTISETARRTFETEVVPMSLAKIAEDTEAVYWAGMNLFQFLGLLGLLAPLPANERVRGVNTTAERKKRVKALLKKRG